MRKSAQTPYKTKHFSALGDMGKSTRNTGFEKTFIKIFIKIFSSRAADLPVKRFLNNSQTLSAGGADGGAFRATGAPQDGLAAAAVPPSPPPVDEAARPPPAWWRIC